VNGATQKEGPDAGGGASSPDANEPTRAPTSTQAPARVIAGIDPGSRHVAVTVLRAGTPAAYVAHLALTIGRHVPLAKPKVIDRKGGGTITKTTRHVVTDEDVDELLRTVAGFLAEHEVDEAVVETATFAHKGAGAFLLRSNEIGGEIRGWLRAAGLPVARTSSKVWRASARRVAGERRGASDARDEVGQDVRRGGTGLGRRCRALDRSDGSAAPVDVEPSRTGEAPPIRAPVETSDGAQVGGVVGRPQSAPRVGQSVATGGASVVPLLPPRAADVPDPRTPGRHPVLEWRAAVRALVTGLPSDLPAEDREHILDAAGCALIACAPPPAEVRPAPVRTRAPRGGGAGASKWTATQADAQRARRLAERRAAGCACEGRCRAPCPVAVAANERRGESMRGNQNARKERA